MKDFTDITVILDRSGSMAIIGEATISGFDEFVNKQKTFGDNAALTLVQFDDQYDEVWNGLPINIVPSIKDIFKPRGMTALLDAVGKTIVSTGERLSKIPEPQRPNKIICVIITDGYENASREYTYTKIREMINHQTSNYNWSFIFLGANQNAILAAGDLGIKAGWAANYNANVQSVQKSFTKMSDHVNTYRCCTSTNEAVSFAGNDKLWTDEDRESLVKDK